MFNDDRRNVERWLLTGVASIAGIQAFSAVSFLGVGAGLVAGAGVGIASGFALIDMQKKFDKWYEERKYKNHIKSAVKKASNNPRKWMLLTLDRKEFTQLDKFGQCRGTPFRYHEICFRNHDYAVRIDNGSKWLDVLEDKDSDKVYVIAKFNEEMGAVFYRCGQDGARDKMIEFSRVRSEKTLFDFVDKLDNMVDRYRTKPPAPNKFDMDFDNDSRYEERDNSDREERSIDRDNPLRQKRSRFKDERDNPYKIEHDNPYEL